MDVSSSPSAPPSGPTREAVNPPPVETNLVWAHGIAAIAMLFVALTFGILASTELLAPDLSGGASWLSWGRLRYDHTQGIMFGWLANAFFAFLYHAVPILTGRRVTSVRLGQWLFGLWNFAIVIPGWALVLAGFSQPLEWAEFPLIVDLFVVVAFLLAAIQFVPPFFAKGLEDLYVSSWYIIGCLVFTFLAYPMGNFVPELVPGARGAAFSGLWIHDAVGLYVTPLALAVIYFVIPAATRRPIYSHFLSMLGFWLLFFLYPLNGTHHYIFSIIPMNAQIGAITASALLGFDVILVVTNLLLSVRGSGFFARDVPLRFVATSSVFYLIVSIQGSIQALMPVNRSVHFSDWVVGHSHLAMLGFATFAAAGGLTHIWQRIPWARYNARAVGWAYWLLLAGVVIMVTDLTLAGLAEARLWQTPEAWLESVRVARGYWLVRTLSSIPLTAGFVALLVGITTGRRGAGLEEVRGSIGLERGGEAGVAAELVASGSGRALRMSYLVAGLGGVGFFAMSVLLLGVWPGQVLQAQIDTMSPEHPLALTASEERGRLIYAREGCAYCHTQQIRHTAADISRFGAPVLAWETRFDYPHLWGTRRIGPDLSREGSVRTPDWQLAHLYSPRGLVPDSVMPAYPALFDGSPDAPAQEGRDLVAYLESLGRGRELAGPEGEARAREACDCPGEMEQMEFDYPELNASPAKARREGPFPRLDLESADLARGRELYDQNCAGCHGSTGQGDGPGAAGLHPRPTNFAEHEYTVERLGFALWNGVAGTAMPAWREFPTGDLSAIAAVVESFSQPGAEVAVPAQVSSLGPQVYTDRCAQCHGDKGAGDGSAVGELTVAPTNFQWQRPTLAASERILRTGIEGTKMADWTDELTDDELVSVAAFVREFYPAPGEGAAP